MVYYSSLVRRAHHILQKPVKYLKFLQTREFLFTILFLLLLVGTGAY
jgi:hypothetical protein